MEIKRPHDIYEALMAHKRGDEGAPGPDAIMLAVVDSELREEWKVQFLAQYCGGVVVPESFRTEYD